MPAAPAADPPVAHIAVLAYRGQATALAQWQPTADYLSRAIPAYRFKIEPLLDAPLEQAVAKRRVEFVITNPGSYAILEAREGVTRLLTLRSLSDGPALTRFGAVIFTRADRGDIQSLRDLRGKSFMGARRDAFGGFQMAWLELKRAGIDPFRDLARLEFAGPSLNTVVYRVSSRGVDAGTVRTGTLERMAAEGEIELGDFKVIHPRQHDGFPFLASTQLYPEWAFAKLRGVDENLAQKVVIELLQLSPASQAARASESAGWTVPLDYTPVHDLYKELRIGPYENLGKLDLNEIFRQYWYWFVAVIGSLLLLIAVTAYILRINRRISQSQQRLIEITRQLEHSNRVLQHLSIQDGLTGVANHRHLVEVLEHAWDRGARSRLPLSLLMVDIDHFKRHNDEFGHQAGDECLKKVAQALRAATRQRTDLVARYGGEEFAVVLPDTDARAAAAVAEKLRLAVQQVRLDYCPGAAAHVTVSVGVATRVPTRQDKAQALVTIADQALYRAKQAGRNQVVS